MIDQELPAEMFMMRLSAVLLLCLMSADAAAQQFATVTTNAPIYASARETPTPLRVAAVGTRLRVVSREGDWVEVEYNDPQLGRRMGWVLLHYISLSSQDLRPMDLSVPEATPVPPVQEDAAPAPSLPAPATPDSTMTAFPRWETSLGWSFLRVPDEFFAINSAVGWNVSVAGNVSPWLGIVGDASANYKAGPDSADDLDVTYYSFLGGPRFSARASPQAVPFAEFLVGFTRSSFSFETDSESSTEFTIQPGGGIDLGNERVAARLSIAWRRVFYEGDPTNMFRFVGGVVIRR
jgi:uncharacterized protein YraI